MSEFKKVKQIVEEQFQKMIKSNNTLFITDTDNEEIWETYLKCFPNEKRQHHTCGCCKSFIRQIGNIITIDKEFKITTLWDSFDQLPEEYQESFKALGEYVSSQKIIGKFNHNQKHVGTDKTPDPKLGVVWYHYHLDIPVRLQREPDHEFKTSVAVFKRGLDELTLDSTQTVIELIKQGSLYRGNEYLSMVEQLHKVKVIYDKQTDHDVKELMAWKWASEQPYITRVRNTVIGQLLQDLSDNKDLERSVSSFESMVAPSNYKRPTALVTPRMVESAKNKLHELGLMSALERRILNLEDLSVADALYVHRDNEEFGMDDVFSEISGEAVVDTKKLQKVEEISIDKFIKDVLPNSTGLKVLVEHNHLGNFATLTGGVDSEAKSLFHWDNSYGWSYSGGVADSIKEKVKKAGGSVDGWGRFSLSWYNTDDLDIHFKKLGAGGEHVSYRIKRGKYAHLDVDMNAGSVVTDPVENIFIPDKLPKGNYHVWVNNYSKRNTKDVGFEIEIEINGEIHNLTSAKSPNDGGNSQIIKFSVDSVGNVDFESNLFSSTKTGVSKWGVKTGSWHQVNAITTSPNHWTKPVGNKHLFFLIKGCVSDEITRPFYNEFLTQELAQERKFTEILANKIVVKPTQGVELSGLGFSETIRNHMYIETQGTFKRTLKVLF